MENMGNSSARPDGKSVRVKKATPISVRLFRGIAITIVSIVSFISVFVGVQLHRKSIALFDELVEQQFLNIEKNINHFMQDAKNVTGILAESPEVKNADPTIYSYAAEASRLGAKTRTKAKPKKILYLCLNAQRRIIQNSKKYTWELSGEDLQNLKTNGMKKY